MMDYILGIDINEDINMLEYSYKGLKQDKETHDKLALREQRRHEIEQRQEAKELGLSFQEYLELMK